MVQFLQQTEQTEWAARVMGVVGGVDFNTQRAQVLRVQPQVRHVCLVVVL
jgi:hypothetical protein